MPEADTRERFSPLFIIPPSELDLPTMDSIKDQVRQAAEMRNPRLLANPGKTPRLSRDGKYEAWDANHAVREEFRRLLDPGVLRNNDKKDAVAALKVLDIVGNFPPLD